METNLDTEGVSALVAAIDFLVESTAAKTSESSSKKRKKTELRKSKLESLDGSRKPSKPSSAGESLFRNTLEERTTADDRLNAFMRGETALDGEYYDPDACKQYTLEEIGRIMGVSRERVRQIEDLALRRLWRFFDIMSKRENLTKEDWLGIAEDGTVKDSTIYFPG